MTHTQTGAGLVALAFGIWFLAVPSSTAGGGPAVPMLTDAQFNELVKRAAENVEDGLKEWKDSKTKKDDKIQNYRKARGAAVMIAAYAQANMGGANAKERASLRDAALKLASLIEKESLPAAKKQLDEIKSGVKTNPAAKTDPVPLMKYVKIEEIMKQFSSKPGGSQLEAKLLANHLANKKMEKAKELQAKILTDDYALLAYQAWVIGEIIKDYDPPKKEGKGKTYWKELDDEMRKESLDLMKLSSSKDKDGKSAWKTLTKLDSSCYRCHKIWRKN